MNFGESDSCIHVAIRPNFISTALAVNFRPNTMTAGFVSKPIHVVIVVDNVDRMGADKFESPCKCCLNIHETKISAVNINNLRNSFKM